MEVSDDATTADVPVAFLGRNFSAFAEHNPCDGCSAPCCRMVISPQRTPESFGALDRLRYLVAHDSAELLLDRHGRWQLSTINACKLLGADNRCSVHGTSRKPKICVNYDPHGCWYKRNFHGVTVAPDLIRMDLDAFERVIDHVEFDDDGQIVHIPPYDELRALAENR